MASDASITLEGNENLPLLEISTPLTSAASVPENNLDDSLELSHVSTLTSLDFSIASLPATMNTSSPSDLASTPPEVHDNSDWGLRRSGRVRKPIDRYMVTPDTTEEFDRAVPGTSTTSSRSMKSTSPAILMAPTTSTDPVTSADSLTSATPATLADPVLSAAPATLSDPVLMAAPATLADPASSAASAISTDPETLADPAASRPKRALKSIASSQPSPKRIKVPVDSKSPKYLKQISEILHAQGSHTEMSVKPDPIGKPPVWANGRQALCETLPYYRAYQGGCYKNEGMVRAFMFDDSPMNRDYMDSTTVVVRGGGGMSRDEDGKMIQSKDHGENAQVRALRNNMAHQNPVAIIASDRCKTSPSKMPHMYNVFGWFKPTDIWYEKVNGGKNVVRYRLEKLRAAEPSWWAPQGVTEPVQLGELDKPVELTCSTCNVMNFQIYLNGWMCLNPDCQCFWKFTSGKGPVENSLRYDPRWLKRYTHWICNDEVQPIRPDPFVPAEDDGATSAMSTRACRGRVCDSCNACILRSDWLGWPCATEGCDRYYSVANSSGTINIVRSRVIESLGRELTAEVYEPQIRYFPIADSIGGYRIQKYVVTGTNSYIIHLSALAPPIQEPGGANEMFESLQKDNPRLVRQVMASSFGRGDGRTNHYTTNFGMPYIFVASVETASFDGAPESVNNARACLHFWSKRLIGDGYREFNELLLLGYMEKNEISYHDDGEYGLGPTISTMSLGCAAEFHVRMKAKHYYGVSKSSKYTDATPVPGCLSYAERLSLHSDLNVVRNDKEALDKKKIAIVKKLGLKTKTNPPDVLKIRLNHGDIMIMHGEDLQKYYEHSVRPLGKESVDIKLRFALTCRYVDEGSLTLARRPNYQIKPVNHYQPSWSKG